MQGRMLERLTTPILNHLKIKQGHLFEIWHNKGNVTEYTLLWLSCNILVVSKVVTVVLLKHLIVYLFLLCSYLTNTRSAHTMRMYGQFPFLRPILRLGGRQSHNRENLPASTSW